MLKGIDPLLSGTLLKHLADMGHGDMLALVDRNYPAASTSQHVVELPVPIDDAAQAILSVFPVDTFVEPAAYRLDPVGDEEATLAVHAAFQRVVEVAEDRTVEVHPLERFDFYRRSRDAYLTVATTDDRPYACFLIVKGVV